MIHFSHPRCAWLRRHMDWSLVLLVTACFFCTAALISCVSASIEKREYWPPQPQAPAIKSVAFMQGEYQPSQQQNRGPIKSELIIKGQDSTKIIDGTGGVQGAWNTFSSFAGSEMGGGMLKGIMGSSGVGALLLGFLSWRAKGERNGIRTKMDAQWDEAFNKGFQAGVAAGARGGAPAASSTPGV